MLSLSILYDVLLQIYAVSITIRIVVSFNLNLKPSLLACKNFMPIITISLEEVYYLLYLFQLGFMLIALIWKFDFSPFMVLIIAILNDGKFS